MSCGTLHALNRRFSFIPRGKGLALLDQALDSGCSAFDTAAAYGNGASDRLIGRFLRSRKARNRVTIIGKGGHPHDPAVGRLDERSLVDDLNQSLRNLRVDHIDVYMLHRDDPTQPVHAIMQTLHRFVQAGKVRSLGASNWHHSRIEEANLHALRPIYGEQRASQPDGSACSALAGLCLDHRRTQCGGARTSGPARHNPRLPRVGIKKTAVALHRKVIGKMDRVSVGTWATSPE